MVLSGLLLAGILVFSALVQPSPSQAMEVIRVRRVPPRVVSLSAAAPAANVYKLIGWNDLGMHWMNENFANLAVLPPFNTLLQGLPGTLKDCRVCHIVLPTNPGPHGLYGSIYSLFYLPKIIK